MIKDGYVFFVEDKQIYINTSLGCSGECQYCYLPKIGYSNKLKQFDTLTAEEIIDYIEKQSDIVLNENILISLGCYSECWDEFNKNETVKLIKYFLKRGNQIQLSTKKQILEDDIKDILPLIKYHGQLVIFVSSATISKQSIIERNTSTILERFNNFLLLNKLNIPCVLYLKPVLKGITIKDLELYKKYIEQYRINDVVVGSIFTSNGTGEIVNFSSANKLFYTKNLDEDIIFTELKSITNVFRKSTEVMKKYSND